MFVALALLASIGPALWASAIVVKYRDFRFVVPFLLQFGSLRFAGRLLQCDRAAGVASALQPQSDGRHHRRLPLVHVGGESLIYLPGFAISLGVIALLLWIGIAGFRRIERGFADFI